MIPVCREPFSKPRGWLTWGLLGMALSPLVIGITVTIVSYAGYEVSSNLQSACTRGLSRLTLLTALSEAVTYFVFLCLLPYAALHDCMLNTSNRSIDLQRVHGLDERGAMVALHDRLRLPGLEALGRWLLHRALLHHAAVLQPVHAVHHRAALMLLHSTANKSGLFIINHMS